MYPPLLLLLTLVPASCPTSIPSPLTSRSCLPSRFHAFFLVAQACSCTACPAILLSAHLTNIRRQTSIPAKTQRATTDTSSLITELSSSIALCAFCAPAARKSICCAFCRLALRRRGPLRKTNARDSTLYVWQRIPYHQRYHAC